MDVSVIGHKNNEGLRQRKEITLPASLELCFFGDLLELFCLAILSLSIFSSLG